MKRGPNIRDADLVGMRFARMTITAYAGRNSAGIRVVDAVCDCGNTRRVIFGSLRNGNTRSCGCLQREKASASGYRNATHGHSRHRMYSRWVGMIDRCENPSSKSFHNYGARGITVCARWHNVANYVADFGAPPRPGAEVDRIDNDGGYWCGRAECSDCGPVGRPCNVRWATRSEQQYNCRRTLRVTIDGAVRLVADVCAESGTTVNAFRARVASGWDPVAAATTPSTESHIEKVRSSWRTRRAQTAKEATT